MDNYTDFFANAFGREGDSTLKPFDYQIRLAEEILPDLLNVPTGAGKTAAVLGAWLWRRLHNPESVGRRLIYCLPMRTLVEQTRDVAKNALHNLEAVGLIEPNRFSVHMLYGGEASDEWDVFPERETILIGTQDLLLSRALNRGYAMNRFRWAFHFGLLNNDCFWVFDEVQLFGDGLATTTQLAAMRENTEKLGTFGKAHSLWMSATLDEKWLETIDFKPKIAGLKKLELSDEDRADTKLSLRLNAVKTLQKADGGCREPKKLADFVAGKHARGTQTLIVVNTVRRAQEVFAELEKFYGIGGKAKQPAANSSESAANDKPEIELIHSRFRPAERREKSKILNAKPVKNSAGKIVIATQVIEAGLDISSKLLLTDLAPFSSLVQRFGRCNREGEDDDAEIFWIENELTAKGAKPYQLGELENAKTQLEKLASAAIADLESFKQSADFIKQEFQPAHVLRQRDLVDLFDTTADLSGFDLDVSRFVRGGEERDVSVFWRESVAETIKLVKKTKKEKKELAKMFAPHRDELCSVPIYDAKTFIEKKKAWTFDALAGEWREVGRDNLRTGMIVLLDAETGGYDRSGWNPKSKTVEIVPLKTEKDATAAAEAESNIEAVDDDNQTFKTKSGNKFLSYTQTLQAHSREVKQAAERILTELKLPELAEFREQIVTAARHHDLGKAHPIFQATVHGIDKKVQFKDFSFFAEPLAKAVGGGKHRRKKFRHELASALALLARGASPLEIYLAACHHGKVRLSIRALPDEDKPFELNEKQEKVWLDKRFARGVWDDDKLPETNLGDNVIFPATTLNLDAISLGRSADGEPSWLETMLNLRDELGVFRLAYLEAVIRAADVQASACPQDYKEKGDEINA